MSMRLLLIPLVAWRTFATPTLWRLVVLLVLASAMIGCSKKPPTLEELLVQCEKLPGLRASKHSELQAEYRLIEKSHTLPEEIDGEPTAVSPNALDAIKEVFDDHETLVEKINSKTPEFLATVQSGKTEFVATDAQVLAQRWMQPIRRVVKASEREQADFGFRFARGYFNDISFLEQSAAACRLLLVDSMGLTQKNPETALLRFQQAWKWIGWLETERHLESRLLACELRADALIVAKLLANRPGITHQELVRLRQQFQQSLANLPTTKETLQGERALALVTYEAIRFGLTEMLFSSEEWNQLQAAGMLDTLRKATPNQIDADEAKLLAYYRELIATTDQPYYVRRFDLAEFDRQLASIGDGDRYAWFANRLFAENLMLAQAALARDRARLEGWVLALSSATLLPGSQAPPTLLKTNPFNGQPYLVVRTDKTVQVQLFDSQSVNPRLSLPQ